MLLLAFEFFRQQLVLEDIQPRHIGGKRSGAGGSRSQERAAAHVGHNQATVSATGKGHGGFLGWILSLSALFSAGVRLPGYLSKFTRENSARLALVLR